MDKEDVARIYNGVLLSHKKKWNSAICRDVDGPSERHTEWSKSERENNDHILMHIWGVIFDWMFWGKDKGKVEICCQLDTKNIKY